MFTLPPATHTIMLSRFLTVKYCDPTEYVPTVPFLTNVVTSKKIWLSYKNYEQEPVRDQVLKVRAVSRETLLNNEIKHLVKDQLVHNLTSE